MDKTLENIIDELYNKKTAIQSETILKSILDQLYNERKEYKIILKERFWEQKELLNLKN